MTTLHESGSGILYAGRWWSKPKAQRELTAITLQSTDGGETWVNVQLAEELAYGLASTSDGTFTAVANNQGRCRVFLTGDDGETWSESFLFGEEDGYCAPVSMRVYRDRPYVFGFYGKRPGKGKDGVIETPGYRMAFLARMKPDRTWEQVDLRGANAVSGLELNDFVEIGEGRYFLFGSEKPGAGKPAAAVYLVEP